MDPDPVEEVPPADPDELGDAASVAEDSAELHPERRLGPLPDRRGATADDGSGGGQQPEQ